MPIPNRQHLRPLATVALLGLALLLSAQPRAMAQDDPDADPVLADDLEEHIDVLASDLFEGRGTGTVGERRAAAYIVGLLDEYGLQPAGEDGGWFQSFPVPEQTPSLSGKQPEYDFPDGRNILALLPGSDPELARQVVVLGAHYDHVGKHGLHGGALDKDTSIHNGADDNASGSALLLELAAYFTTCAQPPRRSILFQWYSGEELGLLGSTYWVEHPTRALEDVVAMVNTDMVGRLLGGTLLVGGVGTSPGFPALVEDLAPREGILPLLDPVGGAPSDSLAFYQHKIPVLFLFTGVHGDYHRATDDSWKINGEGAERVARLALRLVRALADADEPPPFTLYGGMSDYWTPKVVYGMSLGEAPAGSGAAACAAVVVPDGAAGRAGLREGDLLVSVDGHAAEDASSLIALLEDIDDLRTAKRVEVLRPLADGTHEPLQLAFVPEVR